MAAQGLGSKKITDAWSAAVDNEAVVAEASLGAAQGWATTWCGSWFVSPVLARQCYTAQSSFNRRVHQISLTGTSVVERARNTAPAVSRSCQARRLAGTFDPCV